MADRPPPLDRRRFFRNAALAIPAFHAWTMAPSLFSAEDRPGLEVRSPLSIRKLRLGTAQLSRILPFYEQNLGLPIVTRSEHEATLRAGASEITFHQVEDGSEPIYHVAFNIPENKLERAISWAKPRFELLTDPRSDSKIVHFRNWNAHSVFFVDPANNLLEFIARHELDNESKGEFSADEILNTSEIGVVVEDVPATTRALVERLGVEPYVAPPNAAFCAVGDANGLFICVSKGRKGRFDEWPGFQGIFPTEIVLDGTHEGATDIPGYPYRIRVV